MALLDNVTICFISGQPKGWHLIFKEILLVGMERSVAANSSRMRVLCLNRQRHTTLGRQEYYAHDGCLSIATPVTVYMPHKYILDKKVYLASFITKHFIASAEVRRVGLKLR